MITSGGRGAKGTDRSGGVPTKPTAGGSVDDNSPIENDHDCGLARPGPNDELIVGDTSCANGFNVCTVDPTHPPARPIHVIRYQLVDRRSGEVLDTGYRCQAEGPPQLTAAQIQAAAERLAPPPTALSGGDRYVVNAAVVFYARSANGADPTNVVLVPFNLLGHVVAITLTIQRIDWDWGDGTSTDVHVDPTGRPYTSSLPCESMRVCTPYVSHVYAQPGTFVVRAHAYWTATATVDGKPRPLDVNGVVDRGDGAARTVQLFTARSVLVPR